MGLLKFEDIAETARLWIFGFERALTEPESGQLNIALSQFMAQWTAHKRELVTAWELRYRQFIFVAVDERMMGASGCSIDALARSLGEIEKRLAVNILNTHALVFYRNENDEIETVNRPQFKNLAEDGGVNGSTTVFNNTIQSVGELRMGKWETAMKNSWHWQAFGRLVSI
jgi:hypothetical protein